jgi:hypothetical protein
VAPAPAPAPAPPTFGPPSQQGPGWPQRRPESGQRLSERTALKLSLGITVASWGAIFANAAISDGRSSGFATFGVIGAFLGPSTGHWYRGAILTRGMISRMIGGAVMIFGIALGSSCDGHSCETAVNSILGGMALVAIGSADDIITAPFRMRAHNRSLQDVTLAPMVTPHSAGLALGARF